MCVGLILLLCSCGVWYTEQMAFSKPLTGPQKIRIVIYELFLKRTSTYSLTILGMGVIGLWATNISMDALWASRNAGVS